MVQFISFAVIFGVMVFIWTFVFLNRSHDKNNQSFLYFLTAITIWMVLSISNDFNDMSAFGLVLKTLYWYSMLTMSLFFLLFIYRFTKRRLDAMFVILVSVDLLTIMSRYLYPIDYSDPTFWRLSDPIAAPAMSAIFSLPAIFALYLVLKNYMRAKDKRQKAQYGSIFLGIGLALVVSVISEYVLPVLFHVNTKLYLMYYAFLVFVVFIFYAIMKHRLLYIQSDYIYKRLFLNSVDGIIIVNRNSRIININNMARQILRDENLSSGELLADYIREYSFDTDYMQQEIMISKGDQEYYLTLTQYPIDTEDKGSEKLIVITDVSAAKLHHKQETDLLLEKSTIDKLTGVYNKQYFVDKYCGDQGQTRKLSLLFIDVDNFKNINDQYGHLTGDKVLTALADCLKKTIRKCNEIIRFGGDEFIILLENTEIRQAFAVAERIRGEVNSKCISIDDHSLKITLSIGLIEGVEPVNDLLMKADMAMYQSKGKGKNAITIFSENDNDAPYRMKL